MNLYLRAEKTVLYLQIARNIGPCQNAGGGWKKNRENGEKVLLESIKDAIVGIEVGRQQFN